MISVQKRGKVYQFCFEAAKVNEKGKWFLGITKTIGSQRKIYISDSLYAVLINYKNIQNNLKEKYGKKYKKYITNGVKNKFDKLIEYKIIESYSKNNKIEMVFIEKMEHILEQIL